MPNATLKSEGQTWLDQRHPDYVKNAAKWRYAQDHYAGEVLSLEKVTEYLVRKASAESETMFLERAQLADYTPHFSAIVDALAGMLFAVEEDAIRFLGDDDTPGLGDPEDQKEAMYRLWKSADGQSTGWITLFKQLAIELIVHHRSWMLVDQRGDKAVVKVWPALSVVNWWFDEDGSLSEVLITEMVDARKGLKEKGKIEQQWVLYTKEGWERWRKNDRKEPEPVKSEPWGTQFKDAEDNPILPIFPVELPLRRHVGYLLAKKANAIFNKESERDSLLRSGGFPLLLLAASDVQFKSHTENLKKGVRALQDDPKTTKSHQFIAPDTSSATAQSETLKRKVEEFYVVAFREYGDAAREKTATESRQDVAAGVGAFLQMLKAAVDDAENQVMLRVAQIEYPTDSRRWFSNHIERSDTFVPTDIQAVMKSLKERYLPTDQPMPLGLKGMFSMAKQSAQYDGIEFDENEMKAAIVVNETRKVVDLFDKLPIPDDVKVDVTLNLIIALGYVNPEEKIKLEDESEVRKIDQLREEMMDQAATDREAKALLAQPFGPFGGGGGDDESGGFPPKKKPMKKLPPETEEEE